jgi:hypothetical protein
VVAGAGVEHVAVAHHVLEGAPQLLRGDLLVDVVHLVEIDAVGLQAAQRRREVLADLVRGEPGVAVGRTEVAHRVIHVGRQDDLVPDPGAGGEPGADDLSSERPLPASAP